MEESTPQQMDFFYEGDDLEALHDMVNYQDWILKYFKPHLTGNVLEIGAGIGAFSELIIPQCKNLTVVEPDQKQFKALAQKFKEHKNVTTFNGLSDDFFETSPPNEQFDSIIMVNVLEHIENDLETLNKLYASLKPQGKILIFVPACMALYSEFDKLVGHFRRYNKKELQEKAIQSNFNIIDIRYFDMVGMVPWWIFNTKMAKTDIDPKMAKIYDRFIVPINRFMENCIKPPIGKNLVLIASKE